MTFSVEECWALVGERRGNIWFAKRVQHSRGERVRVEFDAAWAIRREERRGDIVGFYHTHPPGNLQLSGRDIRTMRAWCGSFGKALLCVIESDGRIAGYRFDDDESNGTAMGAVELFAGGILVGVDDDGGKTASRGIVSRRGKAGEIAERVARALRRGRARVEPCG